MTSAVGLAALAIASATVTFVLIIYELHLRALNMRVSKAVIGVPGQPAPFQDVIGWLSMLGMRYRRFYSPEDFRTTANDRTVVWIQSLSNLADLARSQNR